MNACPFCDNPAGGSPCPECGRDPTLSRRPCPSCKKLTPMQESECCHCGRTIHSDLRWKIPLIIALFVVAFALSIAIEVWR